MDRIWQWAWDRYATRYTWAFFAVTVPALAPVYLFSSGAIVAIEGSSRYLEAAAVTCVAVPLMVYVMILPGVGVNRLVDRWAAGREVDRAQALRATFTSARRAVPRVVVSNAVGGALLAVGVGTIAGATASRLVQYGILGAVSGTLVQLIAVHSFCRSGTATGQDRDRR